MKKMLSMIMAIAMVASLAVTAFADDSFTVGSSGASDGNFADTTKTFTSTVKSKVKAPTIKVTIPTTNNVYLNPYKMAVAISDTVTQNGEIVALPSVIKNESDCKLAFSAVVTGKAATGVTLEKASVKKKDGDNWVDAKKTNSVFMFVYFKNADTEAAAAAITAPNPDADDSGLVFTATTNSDGTVTNANAIVVGTTASKSTKVLELAATTASVTATYGAFTIGGNIVGAPDAPWTEKHTVDVTVALSIAPVQAS